MKVPVEKAALLWQAALREIGAVTPDQAVWLHSLARRVYHPETGRLAFAQAPIHIGGVWLYPLSLAWLQWLETVCTWWGPNDLLPAAYACSRSDGHSTPDDPFNEASCRDEIATFAGHCNASAADLQMAVRWLLAVQETVEVSPEPDAAQHTADWGELLCMLSAAYRIPPWEIVMRPTDEVLRMLDNMPEPSGIYSAPLKDQRRKTALAEFQAAVRHIKKGAAQ